MYVTYEEYKSLGYSAVSEDEFPRYEMQAEGIVRKHTLNRITDEGLRPDEEAAADVKRIALMNQHGVCNIIDTCYAQARSSVVLSSEADGVVKSFSNEGYSETYADATEVKKAFDNMINLYLREYFTAEQLYRGV